MAFVLKIAGKVVSGPFAKREDAIAAARRRGAEVWYVATRWREDADKRQLLPAKEKDSRNGVSRLGGQTTKIVKHYVPCGVEQARVF